MMQTEYNHLLRRIVIFVGLWGLIVWIGTAGRSVSDKGVSRPVKEVLFVSSFHDTHPWTEQLRSALLQRLEQGPFQIHMHNIYLDAKSVNNEPSRHEILRAYLSEHPNVDVIIGSDLEATAVLMHPIDPRWLHIPVVFVSEWDTLSESWRPNIAGVVTPIGIEETFRMARAMFPKARRVEIWADHTLTGRFYTEQAQQKLAPYAQTIQIEYGPNAQSDTEFLHRVQGLDSLSFAILCTWQQGLNGHYYDPHRFYPQLVAASSIPVFTLVDQASDCGFVGGYMLSPQRHGVAVAEKALAILEGTPMTQLSKCEVLRPMPKFDQGVCNQWNIPRRLIPQDAVILHNWNAFFVDHKQWVIGGVLIFLALCTIIVVLALQYRRCKRLLQQNLRMSRETTNMQMEVRTLHSSMRSLHAYTWRCDLRTGVLEYIEGFEQTGLDPRQFDSLERFPNRVHPSQRADFIHFMDEVIYQKKGEYSFVYQANLCDRGHYDWWECRCVKEHRYDAQGEAFECIFGIDININPYKEIERQLHEALSAAERSDQLKSSFVANMSHEIRTPLNAIIGFTDLLIHTQDPEEQQEYEQIITANSDQLLNLINDILDLSKIEAGYLEFHPSEFDAVAVVEELYHTFSLRISEGVQLRSEHPQTCKVVGLDRQRISQVLSNFLSNAVKYTKQGEIVVGLKSENHGVKLYVQDTGVGILPENLSRVFQRFEKTESLIQGTGLGLAICKAIVDAQQGEIGVESEWGKGSLFWAWIPCQEVSTEALDAQSEAPETSEAPEDSEAPEVPETPEA